MKKFILFLMLILGAANSYAASGNCAFGDCGSGAASGWVTDSSSKTTTTYNVGIGSSNPSAALDVNAGGNNYFGANVGINSTSPNALLDVNGTGNNYLSANVGIASTSPGSALDIQAGTSGFRVFGTTSKWSKKSGANTACNTTCSAAQCAFGTDTAVLGTLVDCADATADVCICMGP